MPLDIKTWRDPHGSRRMAEIRGCFGAPLEADNQDRNDGGSLQTLQKPRFPHVETMRPKDIRLQSVG